MHANILQAVHDARFCPIGALSNLAFYCAKQLELDDAATIFDEWNANTIYPPEKRENCIKTIRSAIIEGKQQNVTLSE